MLVCLLGAARTLSWESERRAGVTAINRERGGGIIGGGGGRRVVERGAERGGRERES